MMETVQSLDGKLVILEDWQPRYNVPEMARAYWPTGADARFHQELIGKQVTYVSGGAYRVNDTGRIIHLENGGETYPIKTETKPIPQPRGKKRYERGQWR